jgi:hypothetical protein
VSAPEELRAELYPLSTTKRVQRLIAERPAGGADPASATRRALWSLAGRHQTIAAELDALNADLAALTRQAAPRLLARYGVGVETAGSLLVTAGDNPDRLGSEAALAACARPARSRRPRARPSGTGSCGEPWWLIAAGVPGCMACPAGPGRRHKFASERLGMPGRLVRLIASLAPAAAPDEGKWAGLWAGPGCST